MKSYEIIRLEDVEMNPFTLSFGVLPQQFVSRDEIIDLIETDFNNEFSESNIYIFTGLRGVGKTVMLNRVRKDFIEDNNWIVININPELNVLEELASKLFEKGKMNKYFLKKSFSFSFKGISFEIEGSVPISNIETLIEKMLTIIKEKKKKVLITIDEISNNQNIKAFCQTFKNLIMDEYPIYLLGTGLYENIYDLENEKTLTFLYRAKKIEIKALNMTSIARVYKKVLGLEEEVSLKAASLTKGYASAFQILGSILYRQEKKEIDDEVLIEFDRILEDINYGKLWSELSMKEKEFLYGFNSNKENRAIDIISRSSFKQNCFSKYRERLLRKGIIETKTYGYLNFTLPRFFEFISNMKKLETI